MKKQEKAGEGPPFYAFPCKPEASNSVDLSSMAIIPFPDRHMKIGIPDKPANPISCRQMLEKVKSFDKVSASELERRRGRVQEGTIAARGELWYIQRTKSVMSKRFFFLKQKPPSWRFYEWLRLVPPFLRPLSRQYQYMMRSEHISLSCYKFNLDLHQNSDKEDYTV